MLSWLFAGALVLLPALHPASAVSMNVTIDDTDTSYFTWDTGAGATVVPLPWANASVSQPCDYCSAHPEQVSPDEIYNKTWHDGHVGSAGSITFQGSAVYIYGIDIGNSNSANITFSLDGSAPTYHKYSGPSRFVFNSLFFTAENLAIGGSHTVSWTLIESTENGTSALFDYAIVSTEGEESVGGGATNSTSATGTADPVPATTASTGTPNSAAKSTGSREGPIVGGVLGGIAFVLLGATGILFIFHRRRRRRAKFNRHAFDAFLSRRGAGVGPVAPGTHSPQRASDRDTAEWVDLAEKTHAPAWSDPRGPASNSSHG